MWFDSPSAPGLKRVLSPTAVGPCISSAIGRRVETGDTERLPRTRLRIGHCPVGYDADLSSERALVCLPTVPV